LIPVGAVTSKTSNSRHVGSPTRTHRI
jgi:hypothetical protein